MAKRTIALILIATLGVVGTPAAFSSTSSTATVRAFVAFVGDSNEVVMSQFVAGDLLERANPYAMINVATPGSGIRTRDCRGCTTGLYWQRRLTSLTRQVQPDAYVVDLGINDSVTAGAATTVGFAGYGAKIDWLMRLFNGKPVFWTNLPCLIEPAHYQTGCRAVDAALRAATKRWSNLRLLNWARIADLHPEYLTAGYWGIHLTDTGGPAWAKLVTLALNNRFRIDEAP